jgi:CDP-diacylglycerol---serine O-phosphatidyltransferase
MVPKEINRKKITFVKFSRLFPNIVTIAAICFGLTSIRFALDEKWEVSVIFIIIAGFLDVVDGRLARYLKATSNFGAHLDSLADFVNFSVAPAIVLYLWGLHSIGIKGVGWGLVLFYSVCGALRLARFNSDLEDANRPEWKNNFFTGIPAPVGAYLAIMPIMLSFEFDFINAIKAESIGSYMAIIGLLMASRIPTMSTKKMAIRKDYAPLVLVLSALFLGLVTIKPWILLPLLGAIYIASILFSIRSYKKMEEENKK